MNEIDRIMAMDDDEMVDRETVAGICAECAEKMRKNGMKAIHACLIKAALLDAEVQNAVRYARQGVSQTPKLELTQLKCGED